MTACHAFQFLHPAFMVDCGRPPARSPDRWRHDTARPATPRPPRCQPARLAFQPDAGHADAHGIRGFGNGAGDGPEPGDELRGGQEFYVGRAKFCAPQGGDRARQPAAPLCACRRRQCRDRLLNWMPGDFVVFTARRTMRLRATTSSACERMERAADRRCRRPALRE